MKPLSSVSIDLDNKWSYMKTHGDRGWEELPSYLDELLPRVLDFFHARNLPLTCFIVGLDAAQEKNKEALSLIVAAGQEVANHSFHHEPWLHRYSPEKVRDEINRSQDAIEQATGVRPSGFRGPGFSCSTQVLRFLAEGGFSFDASTFPTYLGPAARAYYLMTSGLSREERKKREHLFGTMGDGLRPLRPYYWQLGEQAQLLEIPVTTFPVVKSPFHLSYVLYLSSFSEAVANAYFRSALIACKTANIEPSLLLHPLDFLGNDDVQGLDFFPGMALPGSLKRERVSHYLALMGEVFEISSMGQHAQAVRARPGVPYREPDFD